MFDGILIDPPFPRELVIGLGVLLGALAVVGYVRARGQVGRGKRMVLTFLRLAVIAGLTVILLRPMGLDKQPSIDKNALFTVLVDVSQSMNTCDEGETSRFQHAVEGLKDGETGFLSALNDFCRVQCLTFSDNVTPMTFGQLAEQDKVEGPKTALAAALANAASMAPKDKKLGVLLVSDGRENEGGEVLSAANYLKSMNIPVWTTVIGKEQTIQDVFVAARMNQSFLFAKQEAPLKIEVSQTGYTNWYAKLDVLREGQVINTQQVKFNRSSERLEVPIKEDVRGTYKYTVRVEPLRGEADPANNERTVFVRVADERSRILLVEAQPYWDTKFLLRGLHADPNFEVTSIFFLSAKNSVAMTQKLDEGEQNTAGAGASAQVRIPRTREEFDRYDCIILGKGIETVYSATELAALQSYVKERGGNLIFARGYAGGMKAKEDFRELIAELEPVEWDLGSLRGPRFELTPAGTVSPVFYFGDTRSAGLVIKELPEMISVAKVKDEKTMAVILAKGKSPDTPEEMAAVMYHRYGQGKVLSLGSTGLWRWAFIPEKLDEYEDVYARFWGQLIRWLVFGSDFLPGQEVSFQTERFTYNLGEPVPFVIRTRYIDVGAYRPEIELTTPGKETLRLAPAAVEDASEFYTASFTPEQEGEYKAVLRNNVGEPKEDTLRFAVYADSIETRIVSADRELMQSIADVTSGEALTIEQWNELPERVRAFEQASRELVKPDDVWDKVPFFFALAGLLALEWFARRRLGLV